MVYSGAVPLTSEQAAYLHSLSVFDHAVTGVSALLNLSGAIALFLLRKEALYLFGTGFVVIIVTTLLHAIFKGFLSALGGPGVWGMLIGLGIVAAVCWYTSRLKVRGVLV